MRLEYLLPYAIRNSDNVLSFKKSIKTYLFTEFINNASLFF